MRVLVTGGGGFIGSHLVDSQLAQGHEVRTVDLHVERLRHVADEPRLEIIQGNITDERLLPGLVADVDVIYHLASAHLDVRQGPEHYRRVNVAGTLGLLQAAKAGGVSRFVHCSSVGVIGNVENPPADETTSCQPTNIYEQTKLEGEMAACDFAHRTGFPLVVARPSWAYGPRCPRTAKLMRTIAKGRFVFFGDGRNLRHPVYVSDVVQGLQKCALADAASGETYILAGECAVSTRELVEAVAEVQGVRPPSLRLPTALGAVAGYTLEVALTAVGRQPPFSRRSLDFFLKDNAYDITKARQQLGYRPQVDLRHGLRATLRAHGPAHDVLGDNGNHG